MSIFEIVVIVALVLWPSNTKRVKSLYWIREETIAPQPDSPMTKRISHPHMPEFEDQEIDLCLYDKLRTRLPVLYQLRPKGATK